MMTKKPTVLTRSMLVALLLIHLQVAATINLPYLFSSHMVLQRGKPIKIWGRVAAGQTVTVRFHNQTKKATAGTGGNWSLFLDPEPAGGPYSLHIGAGADERVLEDVLVGEVWVCSGQSNMEWPLTDALNANAEIAAATDAAIRQFDVPNKLAFSPQANTDSTAWVACSPKTAGRFSAVAYFFARKLRSELGVPVGIINTTWGGTVAEAWMSNDALQRHPDFANALRTMPRSEVDYARQVQKRSQAIIQKFGGKQKESDERRWLSPGFYDEAWPSLSVDKLWEEQGLANFDGVVVYRSSITLSAAQAAAGGTLQLGTIDDDDSTFVNGHFVGATAQWNALRNYTVSNEWLKPGENWIVVKVTDHTGGGGFYGRDEKAFRLNNGETVPLRTKWRAQVSRHSTVVPRNPNEVLSSLYNAMVHPLVGYTIRGVLWYQGESNTDRARQYETLFPLLIKNWRSKWAQGEFPFYFVQLSSYDPQQKAAGSRSTWAELREAQRKALSLRSTGMAVTIDIGERDDIHPKNKQDVGLRLAFIALRNLYGKNLVASGPVLRSVAPLPNGLALLFETFDGKLQTSGDAVEVQSLEVEDAAGRVYPIRATVKGNKVTAILPQSIRPVALRYAWKDDASDANLQNAAGLPAVPFRWVLANKNKRVTHLQISAP